MKALEDVLGVTRKDLFRSGIGCLASTEPRTPGVGAIFPGVGVLRLQASSQLDCNVQKLEHQFPVGYIIRTTIGRRTSCGDSPTKS